MLSTDLITVIMSRVQDGQAFSVFQIVAGTELMNDHDPFAINRIVGNLATELDAKVEDAIFEKQGSKR